MQFVICMIDINNNKFLAKRSDTDGSYGYNPHYGWNKLLHDIVAQLPKTKVKEASLHENIVVILNETGYMMKSSDNESVEGHITLISSRYHQDY